MAETIKNVFGITDYAVFAAMLIISAGIGIYYAIVGRKRSNTQDFLMGGRSLGVFPVAMSVLASFMSAVTLLGTPAEIYMFGTQYVMICISFCFVVPATAYLYLPVFYNLGLTSAYEYLELRFGKFARTTGCIIFWFHMMMYMPVVLYAPALALAEVSGLSIWFSVLSVGLVCTFYTSIGGMKAVVITDLFQTIIMYASVLVIVIKGTYDIGGIDVVWERSLQGERVEFFNFHLDPTVRHTFWSLAVGGYVTWMGNYAANQAMIQRYLTISTLKGAQRTAPGPALEGQQLAKYSKTICSVNGDGDRCLWWNLPALILLIILTSLAGLVIFAYYFHCDPIGTKMVDAPDQLFPRFVMETLRDFPGIPGLFVSGIFSGALSSVSSGVNSLAAVTLEDIIKAYICKDITEIWATRITKGLAMLYGLASIVLVFVAEQLGGVLQAALTIHGIVGGPMLGLFTLGMFFPWSNIYGAAFGLLSGFVVAMWFGMGAFVTQPFHPEAPRIYTNCSELFHNITGATGGDIVYITPSPLDHEILPPYRLSYLWLSAVGFVTTVVVGLFISFVSGPTKAEDVDDKFLSPLVAWVKKLLPGGHHKAINLKHKLSTDTTLTYLRNSSVLSDDINFYPSKKPSAVSCISVPPSS